MDTDTLPGPAGFACTAAASDTAPRAGTGGMCWQAPVRTGGLRRPLGERDSNGRFQTIDCFQTNRETSMEMLCY